jgi:myo-inositol-1-phosphate synthase
MYGVQDWLSFYLKSPQTKQGEPAENDIFKQLNTLKQVLRGMVREQTPELPALNRTKVTEKVI